MIGLLSFQLARFADWIAVLAAVAAWRISRPIAAAVGLAVVASVAHALVGWEALRWASAGVGLVGAWELGRRASRRSACARNLQEAEAVASASHLRGHEVWADLMRQGVSRWALGRADLLGALCLSGMVADGASLLAWVRLHEWVQPLAQLAICGSMIVVSRWPRRSHAMDS